MNEVKHAEKQKLLPSKNRNQGAVGMLWRCDIRLGPTAPRGSAPRSYLVEKWIFVILDIHSFIYFNAHYKCKYIF